MCDSHRNIQWRSEKVYWRISCFKHIACTIVVNFLFRVCANVWWSTIKVYLSSWKITEFPSKQIFSFWNPIAISMKFCCNPPGKISVNWGTCYFKIHKNFQELVALSWKEKGSRLGCMYNIYNISFIFTIPLYYTHVHCM